MVNLQKTTARLKQIEVKLKQLKNQINREQKVLNEIGMNSKNYVLMIDRYASLDGEKACIDVLKAEKKELEQQLK